MTNPRIANSVVVVVVVVVVARAVVKGEVGAARWCAVQGLDLGEW